MSDALARPLPINMPAPRVVPITEAQVTELLRARYNRFGNGGAGEYAFLPQVRNAAGFDATRTFDAVAVSLWTSRGLTIDAFEVKVTRSDWQRELGKPQKAEDACRLVDRFWIVAPAGVVHDGELPPTWGLMEVTAGKVDPATNQRTNRKLRVVTAAPLLHQDPTRSKPVSRDFLVGLLRAAEGAVPRGEPQPTDPADVAAAYQRGVQEAAKTWESTVGKLRTRLDIAEGAIHQFERAAGVRITPGGLLGDGSTYRAAQVGAALRTVLNGDTAVDRARKRLVAVAEQLRHEADRVEQVSRW